MYWLAAGVGAPKGITAACAPALPCCAFKSGSHDAITNENLSVDPVSGETHRRHHVTADGFYKGVKVIAK